jgi:hypothetical protein
MLCRFLTLLIICSLTLLNSCKSQQWPYNKIIGDAHLKTLLVVDLQTGFDSDTISLWVEGRAMIDRLDVSTVPESGFTGVKVAIYEGIGNLIPKIVHKYENGENEVNDTSINIEKTVEIVLKG